MLSARPPIPDVSPDHSSKYERRLFVSITVIVIVIVAALGSTIVLGVLVALTATTHKEGTLVLINGVISLSANHYRDYAFNTYDGDTGVSVTGSFVVSGGATSGIEVFVMNQTNFFNWANGFQSNSYFYSGILTSGTFNLSLPNGRGEYHLVYSNNFSVYKMVETTAVVHYQT